MSVSRDGSKVCSGLLDHHTSRHCTDYVGVMRSNSGPVESSGLARSEWLPWSLQLASYLVCMVTAIGVVGAGAYQLAHAWAQQIVPAINATSRLLRGAAALR